MSMLAATLSAIAAGAVGVLLAAGAYAEATRIPDQP